MILLGLELVDSLLVREGDGVELVGQALVEFFAFTYLLV